MSSDDKPLVIPTTGVSVEIHKGRWKIRTGWPSWGRRSLDVLIHEIVDLDVGGAGSFAKQYRINLNSSSARNGLANRIPAGEDRNNLQQFLDDVAEILANELDTDSRPRMADTSTTKPLPLDWLLYPFWPATGVTGLAAAPSSLKSFLSLAAALQIGTGQEVLAGNTRATGEPGTILYLDWEDNQEMWMRRLKAIEAGAGIPHAPNGIFYRNPKRSLVQSIEELSTYCTELQPRGIIVDSMSAAIDGSMNDSDVVNEFYNAVHALQAPALVITHKSIENQAKRRAAFQGSGMSLARVRMAWNAEKAKNGAIVWECFKDNHGARTNSKLAWEVGFDNSGDQDEYLNAVTIAAINPSRVQLQQRSEEEKEDAREVWYSRIKEALDDAGPAGMLVSELADALDQSPDTIRNRIGEMPRKGWTLVKERDGRSMRWWAPHHHENLLSERNETADGGTQDDLPDPY